MPDAISMLKQDHRKVEGLFDQYKKSNDPDIARMICTELTVHANIEEEVTYPVVAKLDPELEDHAEEEHDEVKQHIAEVQKMGYEGEQVAQLIEKIADEVNHHVKEEEEKIFPKMKQELDDERLEQLGQQLGTAKIKQLSSHNAFVDLTKEELYQLAQDQGLEGRSDMTKDELIQALQTT